MQIGEIFYLKEPYTLHPEGVEIPVGHYLVTNFHHRVYPGGGHGGGSDSSFTLLEVNQLGELPVVKNKVLDMLFEGAAKYISCGKANKAWTFQGNLIFEEKKETI